MSIPSVLSRAPDARERLDISKKRKRGDVRLEPNEQDGGIDRRPFVVRPAGIDPFAKTRTFTPICVITRSQLPLSWLDTAGAGCQLFAADVRALEAFHDTGEEGRVLVAEEKEDGRLFAVERTARKVYALCRLGAWVGRQGLDVLGVARPSLDCAPVKRRASPDATGAPWWSRAAVEAPAIHDADPCDRVVLDMSVQKESEVAAARPTTAGLQARFNTSDEVSPDVAATEPLQPNEPLPASASQDPLEELARQYLDALYISRTSLAYFAKGPLSRARAAFTGSTGSDTHVSALTSFLRETALSSTVMDKKYRDTLPGLVKELSATSAEANGKSIKSKRKKKWRAKRDKTGLFSTEQEYLTSWWHTLNDSHSLASPETIDVALKRSVPSLRSRETYLQIIVVLEDMSLEANKTDDPAPAPQSTLAETQDVDTQDIGSQAVKKSKSKKLQDLHSLLETLLDRLCIWHSLESHTPAKSLGNDVDAAKDDKNDELKSFCIEVIVPFYLSRLPKEAALVNKKLGGPSPPSPAKRKTTTSRGKPGEPAARRPPPAEKQARKPLSRVPTEVLNQPAAPAVPGLHRSATDSQVIKREDSAVALSSIPPIPPQQSRKRRSDLLSSFSNQFGHREVDLDAKAAVAAAKLKKREEQDAQVRDAILAIKKPNRTLANKDIAARADERFAQSLPGKRARPQLQQAHSLPAAVHVAATPKRGSKSVHAHSYFAAPDEEPAAHGSNRSMVPSSSIRYRERPRPYPLQAHTQAISSTPAAVPQTSRRLNRNVDQGVEDTPSRARAVAEYPNLPAALTESPTAKRTSNVLFATPRKPSSASVAPGVGVGETPVASFGKAALVQGTPVPDRMDDLAGAEKKAGGAGESIYDTLGWNDEEYEELA